MKFLAYLRHLYLLKDCLSIAGKVFIPEHHYLTDARFQELMLIIRCNN